MSVMSGVWNTMRTAQATTTAQVVHLRETSATNVAERIARGVELTLSDKLHVYQMLNRVWRRYLSSVERDVLLYIVDRTVGWGKDSFTASAENVLTGTDAYAGLGLSRRAYYAALASLEKLGLLVRKSVRDRTRIILNLAWKPENKEMSDILPTPKRLKEGAKSTSRSAPDARQECTKRTLNTVSGNTVNVRAASADADDADQWGKPEQADLFSAVQRVSTGDPKQDAIETALQRVQRRVRTVKVAASEKAAALSAAVKSRKPSAKTLVSEVETVWRTALVEGPGPSLHVTWSVKERGMISTAMKKWEHARHGTFAAFVDYSVRNWSVIVARKFGWMKTKPAPRHPSVQFLIARLSDFVEVWATDEVSRFATDGTNNEYKRLRASGLSHDEALIEIARRKAAADTHDAVQAKLDEANLKLAKARQREERALRMEGLAEKTLKAPDGTALEVTPGRQAHKGQVWGQHPTIRRADAAPEVRAPAPDTPAKLADPNGVLPSWEEIQARRRAALLNKTPGSTGA